MVSDLESWVGPERWAEAVQQVQAVAMDLHDAARPAGSPGVVLASASMVMFEMDPPA